MKLQDVESFFNSLVFLYCIDDEFINILNAAGIDLNKDVPEKIFARSVYDKFQNQVELKKDRMLAMRELKTEIEFLEKHNMKGLSPQPHILAKQFELYRKKYDAHLINFAIQQEPDQIDEILQKYAFQSLTPVQWDWMENFTVEPIKQHNENFHHGKVIVHIPKFELLSHMIGGFNPSRIGIMMGTTGLGKTNLGLALGLAAREKMGVAYVNMEMSYQDITRRLCVALTGDSYTTFNSQKVSEEAMRKISEHPKSFAMTSGRSLSLVQIMSWVKMLNTQKKINFLVIDYDQKLTLNNRRDVPEWKELQQSIERLEDLAKELDLFCLVLAQVNRDGDISGSHRSTFPAHSVLNFEIHPEHGPLISVHKNRHGKKGQALKVSYNESNSQIKEIEIIELHSGIKVKRQLKKPMAQLPYIND